MKHTLFFLLAFVVVGCGSLEPEDIVDPDAPLPGRGGQRVAHDVVAAVIRPDGTIWTWGFGYCGTLGTGTFESSDYPVQALRIRNAIALDLNQGRALAADAAGNIYSWGWLMFSSIYWQQDSLVCIPQVIARLPGVQSVAFGDGSLFYLLRDDGSVWYPQYDKRYDPRIKPNLVQIAGLSNACQLSYIYALRTDGTLYYLPQATSIGQATPPNRGGPIEGLSDIKQVESVWHRRTVILKRDSTVWAWGWNNYGQLGDGTLEDREQPVRVSGLTDVVAISAHWDYNLALKSDGTVWFWGLENPTEKRGRNTPVMIQGLKSATAIYAGYTSLVQCADGTYRTFDAGTRVPQEVRFR